MEFINSIGTFVTTYTIEIIIVLLVILGGYVKIRNLISNNLIEWLVDKVGDAEAYFGSETGQLKLRSVYNTFVLSRPILAVFISFDKFSGYVDAALDKFEVMLSECKFTRDSLPTFFNILYSVTFKNAAFLLYCSSTHI